MSIVLGFDGRDSSRRALPVAIDLARDLGLELVLVCGVRPPGSVGEEFQEVEAAIAEMDAPALAEGVESARAAGVTACGVLLDALPADALLDVAVERNARLIVVGYGEAGRIRAALSGAVALRLLERTDVPLLVVP
ncbi:MAG: universal stress protein [Candidatus Nanopelagicales bacterium]